MKFCFYFLFVVASFILSYQESEATQAINNDYENDDTAQNNISSHSITQFSIKDINKNHLDDLPLEILTDILQYVSVADPRSVNKLFYNIITGEEIDKTTIGMMACSKYQGIRPIRGFSYDFKNSTLDFSNKIINLNISHIPTWIWHRWITKIVNIPLEYMPYLQGTNINIFCLINNKSKIVSSNDNIIISSTFYEDFFKLLKALKGTNIHTVILRNFIFDELTATSCAQALQQNTKVKIINLDGNDMMEQAVAFVAALDQENLYTITLSNNNLKEYAVNVIQALQGKNVEGVDLSYNEIGSHVVDLGQALKGTNINCIDLKLNNIKEHALAFAYLLKDTSVKKVDLSYNRIDKQMIQNILNLRLPIKFIFENNTKIP